MVNQTREQYVQFYSGLYETSGIGVAGIGLGNKVLYLQKAGYCDGMSFLDYGCGWGAILQGINPTAYLGVDMAAPAVQQAEKTFPGRQFREIKIGQLGINEAFDFVAAISVFTHTPYADVDDSLKDIYLALKPGGRAMVDILEGDPADETEFIRYWRKEEFVKKLHQIGFEIADTFKTIGNYQFQHTFFAIRKPIRLANWDYLKTEPFDLRYKVAAAALQGKTAHKVIVDLNCGEPGLYRYLDKDFSAYHCNDLYAPTPVGERLFFSRIKDNEVDIKMDILSCFGYGGGEFTGQPLESNTAGKTIARLSKKYKPEYIIVEMAQKWQSDYNALVLIRESLNNYDILLITEINILPIIHYHNQRLLTVFQKRA